MPHFPARLHAAEPRWASSGQDVLCYGDLIMKVLVIDVGGTHIKVLATGHRHAIKIDSGKTMTPRRMVRAVRTATSPTGRTTSSQSAIPAPCCAASRSASREIWRRLDRLQLSARRSDARCRLINDAAMQALGDYKGGRMLFLGLGTGLGTALIVDGVLEPMELAHLPYKKHCTYEEYVGKSGLKRLGKKKWRRAVADVVVRLQRRPQVEDVVVGGGNAKLLRKLPPGVRIADNAKAFTGGFRLWRNRRA